MLPAAGAGHSKVARVILKSFFQTGDKPTQAQFSALIDSAVNFVDDRDFIGLREYSARKILDRGEAGDSMGLVHYRSKIPAGFVTKKSFGQLAGKK